MKITTLASLKEGESCEILYINKECSSCKRLMELGLIKGLKVKMVKNDRGPIIININGNKIAIGRCLSNRIDVKCI